MKKERKKIQWKSYALYAAVCMENFKMNAIYSLFSLSKYNHTSNHIYLSIVIDQTVIGILVAYAIQFVSTHIKHRADCTLSLSIQKCFRPFCRLTPQIFKEFLSVHWLPYHIKETKSPCQHIQVNSLGWGYFRVDCI